MLKNRAVYITVNHLDDFNTTYTFRPNDILKVKKIIIIVMTMKQLQLIKKKKIKMDMSQIQFALLQEEHIQPAGYSTNLKKK